MTTVDPVIAWCASAGRERQASTWHGRWHREKADAEAQALRWKFERPDPPDQVFIEALHQSGAITLVATLCVLGNVRSVNGGDAA